MSVPSNDGNGVDIAVNSAGDVYVLGTQGTSGENNQVLFKLNKSATLQWQREYGPSYGAIEPTRFAIDSSENIYINSWNTALTGSTYNSIISKYNSSGVFQISYRYFRTSSFDLYSNDILVNGSGGIYSFHTDSGARGVGYYNDTIVVRNHDTSFNEVWTYGYDSEGAFPSLNSLHSAKFNPPDGHIIASGRVLDLDTNTGYASIYKLNSSSGALISRSHITNPEPNANTETKGLAVDSSGNIYIAVSFWDGTAYRINVMKLNSSYTRLWQRKLSASGSVRIFPTDLCLDQNGNIYVSAYGNDNSAYIFKYNNSGSLQWQRKFDTTGTDLATAIAHDGVSSYFITGRTNVSGNNNLFVLKLPDDGTLTGSYALNGYTYNYTASTITDAAGNLGSTSITTSSYSQSLTRNTVGSPFSESAATQTLSVKML